MLIDWGNKNGTIWELRQGVSGDGKSVYFVQTERKGENGQTINAHLGPFRALSEAKSWIKHAI